MTRPTITRPGIQVNRTVLHYSKDRLPPAHQFFSSELGQLSKADHRGEVHGSCPLHPSKSGRSFTVNLRTGLWYCFSCEVGGDIIAFVRRRYSFTFTAFGASSKLRLTVGQQG